MHIDFLSGKRRIDTRNRITAVGSPVTAKIREYCGEAIVKVGCEEERHMRP